MVFAAVKKDGAWKRRPKQNGAKILGRYKRNETQNLAAVRRIMGRFAKRFSGERPVSLGFELSFYPSLVSWFGGCLTATRSGALV